jgi:hypothetical protein
MKELNTKNLKYNILTVYERFNWKLIPTLIAGITLLITSIGLAYSCSDLKDEVFGFSKSTWFLIAVVSSLISHITINTQTVIQDSAIYLWSPMQNVEDLVVSKEELISNILSNECRFDGFVKLSYENQNPAKSRTVIPISNEEYAKITEHINKMRLEQKKRMNPKAHLKN